MFNVLIVARQNDEINKLSAELCKNDFNCLIATNANRAIEKINQKLPRLLLIEHPGIPESDQLCRYLRREKKLTVIALTQLETVGALNGCADDFVLKPYNAREIIVRARHLLDKKRETATGEQIRVGDLSIDTDKYEVYVSGRPVSLTFKEYELLKFLASNPGRVFSRDALLNQVWKEDYFGGDRTVDVHIRRLRGKIEDINHSYIDTVRNIGYRFKKI